MNIITMSYSREDNFFYFDNVADDDSVSIFSYDITNSMFVLIRTFSKSKHFQMPPKFTFNPFLDSINFYDYNVAYELKLSSDNENVILITYETSITHDMNPQNTNDQKSSSRTMLMHNLQRYNKEMYEYRIAQITRNLFKLDQKETISKFVSNLTFNFNVTFRANVRVNRILITEPSDTKRININRRDYALDELSVSMNKLRQQVNQLSKRKEILNSRLNNDVVYRNQNTKINDYKHFINKVYVKKIYASNGAYVGMYFNLNMDYILDNLYRLSEPNKVITGRKIFTADLNVEKFLAVNKINDIAVQNFLYTDLEQDIYSNFWYGQNLHARNIFVPNGLLSPNISLTAALFINQNLSNIEPIKIRNKLVFDSIAIDHLYVDKIDGIKIGDLSERILTRDHTKQVIKVPTYIERLNARRDINIHYINGHNVDNFFQNLIRINRNVEFNEPVQFLSDVTMDFVNIKGKVNNVKIPDDLMDQHSKQVLPICLILFISVIIFVQTIYGVKRFSSVHTDNINVTILNHLQIPADIVTLSRDETIPGDLVFDRISVRGNLQIDGLFNNLNLTHMDKRSMNLNSSIVKFQNLTFFQPVTVNRLTVNQSINNMDLEKFYFNAYFKDERTMNIPSKKIINNILKCKDIIAETINGEQLDNYLQIQDWAAGFNKKFKFKNNVHFNDVQLNEKIDNVDINELLNEIVFLDGYQIIYGGVNFLDGIQVLNDFKITGTINNVSPNNWLRYSQSQNINSPLQFSQVKCKNLVGEADLRADKVNQKNFTEEAKKLINLNQPNLTLNIVMHCINCSANGLKSNLVNSKNVSHFFENYLSKTKSQTISGEKQFVNIQKFNDIYTYNGIAGIDLKSLKQQAVTRDGYNIITNPVTIHGNLSLNGGQIITSKWNKINIEQFNEDIVNRNLDLNQTIRIQGDIVFQNDIDLMADVRVTKLNKYRPEELLMTKYGNYTIDGDVQFNRKFITKNDIQVNGLVNAMNITELEQNVLKTNDRGELVVDNDNDVINFVDAFKTNDIVVNGLIDNITINPDSIVMTNGEQNIEQLTVDGDQWFNNSLYILSQINNMDKEHLENIVLVDSSETQQIDMEKTFAKVVAKDIIHQDGLININIINNVDLSDFASKAIYSEVDQIVPQNQRFVEDIVIQGPNFKVNGLINGIALSDVVRLDKVRQTITGKKVFDSIEFQEDVDVHGFLNQVHLPTLTKNMLLVYGEQEIKTPLSFIAPVFIMNNSTVDYFNQYPPEDLVSIHGDRTIMINGKLNLNNILVSKLFTDNHLINGVNLTDIYENGFMTDNNLKNNRTEEQIVHGSLTLNKAIFKENISLINHVNNMDFSETIGTIMKKINDPKIDSKQIDKELLYYNQLFNYHRNYLEYVNFEIDYFYKSNFTMNASTMNQNYFRERFKMFDFVYGGGQSLFDLLYKRIDTVWQTVIINSQHRMYLAEILQNNEQETFRLMNIEQMTGQFWNIFEKQLPYGKLLLKILYKYLISNIFS